jgi:glycogen operon protein
MKSVVVDPSTYDREGDTPPRRPSSRTIIYEMHVRGFTRHSSSGLDEHVRYAGLIEKIPYLKRLGITAVELLPVFQFDPQDCPPGKVNYWGYAVLARTKLIAEAWDAAGLYQVGSFFGDSWKERNGRFRDDVRSFFGGEDGFAGRLADRLLGSPEIYGHTEREAEQSVNFVTCHDGFTLNDLVSHNQKHNEPNGEDSRDGANDSRSWNCGVEGPSDDLAIEKLRERQIKNLLTVTLLSLGVPMLLMGDEARRSQRGNNNAYCQDNETSWFDWNLVRQHAGAHRFLGLLGERIAPILVR